MATDILTRLIAAAAACLTCGEEHHFAMRKCGCSEGCTHSEGPSWASPHDGHAYRRRTITVDWLREWATANDH